jgi:hypothetical protein
VEVAAVRCTGVDTGGVLLIAQRLLATGIALILLGGEAVWTGPPAVKAIGLNWVGICVAGSWSTVSVPVIESVPGDAVISCEPQMGHTMSAHEVFAG